MSFKPKKPSEIYKHLCSLGQANESEENTLIPNDLENDRNIAGIELVAVIWLLIFFPLYFKFNHNQLILFIDADLMSKLTKNDSLEYIC